MSPARHLLKLVRGAYGTARYVARHPPLRLTTFAVLALAASWPLLSTAAMLNDFRDANVLNHYESAARESILRWHQAPLWDPYYCGGMYLLGTPQARFVSPTFLFTLLFGESRGEALTAFAMMIVGLEGTYRYMRDRKATRFGALVAAPLFALSGIFAVSPSLGWIGFFGFELLPWMALGVRRALRGQRWAIVLLAVAAAWCVGFGGTYAAPLSALWCIFEVAEFAARNMRRDRRRLAIGLGVVLAGAALAAGLAAVRLWPIAQTLVDSPRIIGGTPGNGARVLTHMFFFPTRPETDDGEFYVGFFVLPAALIGLLRRRSAGLGIAAALSAWLAAGYEVSPSLFAALRELPLYTSLRYPERFLILFGLALTTLAARGISMLETCARTRRVRSVSRWRWGVVGAWAVASLALVIDVGPLVAQHNLHARQRPLIPPAVSTNAGQPFHQARGTRWALAQYEPMARGSLSCWEAYPVPESPLLRGDLSDEARVLPPLAGTLTERSWSPDAIDLDVTLTQPAVVAINQNWHPGWRASAGTIQSDHGLLTVELPAGTHALSLRFEPRSALGGALASLVAAAGLVFLGLRARRAPAVSTRRDGLVLGLVAVLPAVPVLVILATVHQPSFVEPLLTPDGRPVIADGLDPGAVRIDAKFADGIVLEAATLSNTEPAVGSDLTLELDWRRTGGVDPGLGVFVHMEPSGGNGLNGDHVLLSGVLDLADAPPDRTLRDVLPIFIPDDAKGKKWKVWVGLWHVRRGGSRVDVVDSGHSHATVDKGRVLAVTFEPH